MNLLRKNNLSAHLFIVYFAWISFFPEPVQGRYQIYIRFFLGIAFLILLIRNRHIGFLFDRKHLPLWLFIICLTGNIFSAQNREVAVRTYSDISLILIFLYYLTNALFPSSQGNQVAIKAICIFSFLVSIFGIVELLCGKNLIYEYILYNPYYSLYNNSRLMSTQFNPTPLATFLVVCLPFNFILLKDKAILFRSVGVISIILHFAVILFTFSRGAFLSMFCVFFFFLWNIRKRLLCSLLIVIFLGTMFLGYRQNIIWGFANFGIRGILYDKRAQSILSPYRTVRLKMALHMIKDYPLFGIGLKHFHLRFDEYAPRENYIPSYFVKSGLSKIADNMYLTILSETGIVGFLSFFIFIFFLLRRGLASLHKLENGEKRNLLLVSMASMFGLLVNMAGYELFYWHTPFALFCILCGIIRAHD